ncbi:MAG: hypothetical protein M1169_04250 [Firmicutes bacterium]|nr:hypothetical protein [Bacillota bacterium]
MKKAILLAAVIFSFSLNVFGQGFGRGVPLPVCPGGNQIHINIILNIGFSPKNITFKYAYTIASFPDSKQNVWEFTLEYLTSLISFKSTITKDAGGPVGWRHIIVGHPLLAYPPDKTLPVNAISWGSDYSHTDIFPGNSLSGFFVTTTALPGIVRSWTQGDHPLPSVPESAAQATCGPPDPYSSDDNVILKTVGPDILPKNLTPVQLLTRLISLKEQAFQLGWITNAGVANSLDAKLNEAKKKLQEGETQVTINLLKSFILDLEAQHQGQTGQGQGASTGNAQTSRKHVTDNAYYLLKPNAEFILYKLGVTNFQ